MRIADDKLTIKEQLDQPEHIKGKLVFTLADALAADQKIPVVYQLALRKEKLGPALAVLLFVFAIAYLYRKLQPRFAGKDFATVVDTKIVRAWSQLIAFACLATFIYFNCGNPGWAYGDSHQFLTSTVQGKWLPATVYPDVGRFFPLGLVDINCLIPFGNNPLAYHIERALLLCLVVLAMYFLVKRISNVAISCFVIVLFLTTPDLFRIYSESIFPESLLIVCLVSFFLFYQYAQQSRSWFFALAACVSALAATYCKEPAFGLLLVFSLVQVVFGYREIQRPVASIHLFIALNAAVFLGVYWSYCSGGASYAEMRNEGSTWLSTFLKQFHGPLGVMAIGLGVIRAYSLIVQRDRTRLFSDGVLFSGLAYAGAYVLLRLGGAYYMTPAYACWAIAVGGYLSSDLLKVSRLRGIHVSDNPHRKRLRYAALMGLVVIVCLQARGTVECVRDVIANRSNASMLSNLFEDLEDQGFTLSVFYARGLEGHMKDVQDWRTHVLNIFDYSLGWPQTDSEPFDMQQPFHKLALDDLHRYAGKIIVVSDPRDCPMLDQLKTNQGPFQRVTGVPNVMGADVYTQAEFVAEVQQSLTQTRKTR